MTKKDYKKFAAAFARVLADYDPKTCFAERKAAVRVVLACINVLAEDNEEFDGKRFVDVCLGGNDG